MKYYIKNEQDYIFIIKKGYIEGKVIRFKRKSIDKVGIRLEFLDYFKEGVAYGDQYFIEISSHELIGLFNDISD